MKHRLPTITLLCLTCLATWAQAAEQTIFRDFDGQPRTVDDYAGDGRWLVVMIWAHDCHVCNMEAESYAQFHEAHKEDSIGVLGISMDGEDKKAEAAAFVERHALPFPNLIGDPELTMLYYMMQTGSPFRGTPSILIYDPQGTLKAAQAGAVPVENIEVYIAKPRPGAAG